MLIKPFGKFVFLLVKHRFFSFNFKYNNVNIYFRENVKRTEGTAHTLYLESNLN